MPSLSVIKANGLFFAPNQLDVPSGSLVEASNIVIDRPDVIELRRGYHLYGTEMGTSTDRCKQLLSYKGKLLRHFANRIQYEDGVNNAGTATFFDFNEIVSGISQQAQITEPQTGIRVKAIEANSNLYLTTSEGIKKISAKSADTFAASPMTKAGGVKALDAEVRLVADLGDQSSFLPPDSGVSYKVLWGTKDANGTLILGAPSTEATVLNSLLNLTFRDFSNFLQQLDRTASSNPGNSLITDTNYYSSLALPITAEATQLKTGLVNTAKKLDEDLLYVTDTGTSLPYSQLQIAPTVTTTASSTSGLTTITVTSASGILEGMTVVGNGINASVSSISGTTITLSSPATLTQTSVDVSFYGMQVSNGTVTTVVSNTLSVTASNSGGEILFTAGSSHGLKAGMTVKFRATTYPTGITSVTTYYVISSGLTSTAFKVSATSGGAAVSYSTAGSGVTVGLTAGSYFVSGDSVKLSGFKSNSVEIESLNSANTVASVLPNRVSFVAANFSDSNPAGISGPITVIPTTKASDTGTVVLTAPSHGLKTSQKVLLSGSDSSPSIDGSYPITSLSDSTFSIDLKKSFSTPNLTGTVSVTFQDTGDTVTYNSHNLVAGDSVVFTVITTTTGIAINTRYYVVNPTTNTFQVASSPGGSALALTNNGTGTMARSPTQFITSANHGYSTGDTVSFNVTSSVSEAVTFTTATSTVTLTAATPNLPHGMVDGDMVQFTSIVTTTGIVINTKYYVVNSTATTFKLAATENGTALTLTTNGTGVMQRLTSARTYYVSSTGLAQNTFQVSSSLGGASATITGTGTVTKQITSAGTSASWNILIDGIASTKIESNTFRSIAEPETPSSPATNNDTTALKEYYLTILTTLQDLISSHGSAVVDSSVYSSYLSELEVSENAYSILSFTIPSDVLDYTENDNPWFYQIYRTDIASVSGVSSISDIAILQEYRQVEEKFPTQAQLDAGIVEFTDEIPDTLAAAGANLYTNERSGEGGLQANDLPPFAKDISFFKNYTFFANTKVRQKKIVNLIGVAAMYSSYNPSNPYKLTISDGETTQTYAFVKGSTETTQLTCAAASALAVSGPGKYFLLNSANDETEYYVWYQVGATTDPAISGKTGIKVVVGASDADSVVAKKTRVAISNSMVDFTASVATNVVTITTTKEAKVTNATIGTLPVGFSVAVTQQGQGEDGSANPPQVLLSSSASVGIAIDETAKSLIRVINRNQSSIVNAFYLSGPTTSPGSILLESRRLSDEEFFILGSDSTIGASFNPDLSPGSTTITGISVAYPTVVTTSAPHNLLNGDKIIVSGSSSTPTINGVHEITWISSTSFSLNINVTASGSGTAVFKITTEAESSSNEEKVHRVYYSKLQQPESVPLLNYLDIGASDKEILRIFPLRDSLFVFKQDGLYRISGEVAPFSVALFDSSCVLTAPDSVSVSNNQVFAWTTQGIVIVTEAGANPISRQIESAIMGKGASSFVNFKTATWGVGYESDNSYIVYTTAEPTDETATIGFRYSTQTNTWTTFDKSVTCGIINSTDGKMYLGAGDTNYIEKERKDFTRYDHADRELQYTIVGGGLSGKTITMPTPIGPISVGDVLVQNQTLTVYEFNMLLKKLDIDPGVPSSDYYATLAASAGDNLKTKLLSLAVKLDGELDPGYETLISTKTGSVSTATVADPGVITTSSPHGLQTGRYVSISGNTQSDVNGVFKVTYISSTSFSIPIDLLVGGTGGVYSTDDSGFNDLKSCYNLIIAKLNSDTIASYSNYRAVDNDTVQEAVIVSKHNPTNEIVLDRAIELVVGAITIYKAIPCSFTYSPQTMGDALGLKHLREATLMFETKAITSAELKFSTDLLPEFVSVPFSGDGPGAFGSGSFGSGFFGGVSNSAPFRTLIPRQCQRCRYINVGFSHATARENFAIYGITITGETGISTRAYR